VLDVTRDIGGCAVHEQIDSAKLGDRALGHSDDGSCIPEVNRERQGANALDAKLGSHLLELRFAARKQSDIGPGARQRSCRRSAKPAARARDKGGLALERSA
jgi:hypothetical protein